MVPTLVLWDVDHTLIETRGVGRELYARAWPQGTGVPLRELASVDGRTEWNIIRETLQLHGLNAGKPAIDRVAAALAASYAGAREELATRGRALPGAAEALAAIAGLADTLQTVLTGNLRAVARIKLEAFDLDRYLDLRIGAYGDDAPDRAQLVDVARQRTRENRGATFDGQDVVLIGDTPHDIRAAITAGVRSLGVATGKASPAELQRAGATAVIDDLTDLGTVTAALTRTRQPRPV